MMEMVCSAFRLIVYLLDLTRILHWPSIAAADEKPYRCLLSNRMVDALYADGKEQDDSRDEDQD